MPPQQYRRDYTTQKQISIGSIALSGKLGAISNGIYLAIQLISYEAQSIN